MKPETSEESDAPEEALRRHRVCRDKLHPRPPMIGSCIVLTRQQLIKIVDTEEEEH